MKKIILFFLFIGVSICNAQMLLQIISSHNRPTVVVVNGVAYNLADYTTSGPSISTWPVSFLDFDNTSLSNYTPSVSAPLIANWTIIGYPVIRRYLFAVVPIMLMTKLPQS